MPPYPRVAPSTSQQKPSCNDQKRRMSSFVFICFLFIQNKSQQSAIVYISKYLYKHKYIYSNLNLSTTIPKPTTSIIYRKIHHDHHKVPTIPHVFFHFFPFPRLPNVTSALRLAAILRRVRWPCYDHAKREMCSSRHWNPILFKSKGHFFKAPMSFLM